MYLVYIAEKNRGLTLRLRCMLIIAWAVGAMRTMFQGIEAVKTEEQKMLPQLGFLFVAQATNIGYGVISLRRLASLDRADQLRQERTKAWLHTLQDVAVMACVILSDPTLPHSPIPLSTMIVTAFLAVLDMLRVSTLLRLHSIKWLCFLFLEADYYMRVPGVTFGRVRRDIGYALTLGTLLPLGFAAVSEAHQREAFLRDCRKPISALEPFWSNFLALLRRVPWMSAPMRQTDLHRD